jgi:hypothetical protein
VIGGCSCSGQRTCKFVERIMTTDIFAQRENAFTFPPKGGGMNRSGMGVDHLQSGDIPVFFRVGLAGGAEHQNTSFDTPVAFGN